MLHLEKLIFVETEFKSGNLEKSKFEYVATLGTKFINVNFRIAEFENFKIIETKIEDCKLEYVEFKDIDLNIFYGEGFKYAKEIMSKSRSPYSSIELAEFSHVNLGGSSFKAINIMDTKFIKTNLEGSMFEGGISGIFCIGGVFRTEFRKVNLRYSYFERISFHGSKSKNTKMFNKTKFEGANFKICEFKDVDLRPVEFKEASFEKVRFMVAYFGDSLVDSFLLDGIKLIPSGFGSTEDELIYRESLRVKGVLREDTDFNNVNLNNAIVKKSFIEEHSINPKKKGVILLEDFKRKLEEVIDIWGRRNSLEIHSSVTSIIINHYSSVFNKTR